MRNILQSINMFHYQQFWRFKGDRQITHKCGGVLTILIFIVLGGIACYQIYLINQRDTITVITQSQIDFSPEFTNITTSQNDPHLQPYMAAIVVAGLEQMVTFSPTDYQLSAFQSTQTFDLASSSYQYSYTKIAMESCTPYHFSKLPNIFEKFSSWGMSKWFCFPINQTFEIGGNILSVKKYLEVSLQCVNARCKEPTSSPLLVNLMTLNTFVNPTNNTKPFMAYFNRREAIIQPNSSSRNFLYLDQTILKTDTSLTPFPQFSTRSSFEEGSLINSDSYTSKVPTSTFYILLSGKTIKQDRNYLKFLTALSFVGGLFAPIVGAFSLVFMMGKFGTLVYELRFANGYFRDKMAYQFHYLSFVTQVFSKIFGRFQQCRRQKFMQQRDQFIKTVKNLMDVVYLQKRIAFLQRCMTVLFEKHQLKALFMLHNVTKEEADQNYQNYKMRANVFKYVAKQQEIKLTKKLTQEKRSEQQIRPQLAREVVHDANQRAEQSCKNFKNMRLQTVEKIDTNDALRKSQRKIQNSFNLRMIKTHSDPQTIIEHEMRQRDRERQDKDQKAVDLGQLNISDEQQAEISLQDYQQKGKQILQQLSKVYFQAKAPQGNEKSRKIYEMLDRKMQNIIKRVSEYKEFYQK